MASLLLSLCDIGLSFGGAALFDGAALQVDSQSRIALVGRNGSGKSTLLKIAAGAVEADAGERFVHPGARVRYLAQEPDFASHENVERYIASGLDDPRDMHKVDMICDELAIAKGLSLAACSGGEARRAALAHTLIAEPDILLLDEPTNHLDIAAISWLEDYLRNMKAAMVLISHDRRFLETLTSSTVWIDRGRTQNLDRGFAYFEAWRDKLLDEEQAAHHKLQRKIVSEEHWMRYGVTARRRRNMRRVNELQALRQQFRDDKRAPDKVKFSEADHRRAGKNVIIAKNIAKAFGGTPIVDDFSIEIANGERIGIVGPNGAGKTTLINLLTGSLAPDRGMVKLGTNLDIVSLDQRRAMLKPDLRVADTITDERGDWVEIGGVRKHAATYLQEFLFASDQWRGPVKALSGGERGRLALAASLAKPSNLLVLDEPTNDLDLETLDLLQEFLADYKGALLLVSHDRAFIDAIATSIITTDPDRPGAWLRYPGGYDDMIAQRGSVPGEMPRATIPAAPPRDQAPSSARPKRSAAKLSFKDKHALETLPAHMEALQTQIEKLTAKLADPALFERDGAAFNRAAAELEEAKSALEAAEDQWLRLEIQREALERG